SPAGGGDNSKGDFWLGRVGSSSRGGGRGGSTAPRAGAGAGGDAVGGGAGGAVAAGWARQGNGSTQGSSRIVRTISNLSNRSISMAPSIIPDRDAKWDHSGLGEHERLSANRGKDDYDEYSDFEIQVLSSFLVGT